MTERTRTLVAPFLSCLCLAACNERAADKNDAAGAGSTLNGAEAPGTGAGAAGADTTGVPGAGGTSGPGSTNGSGPPPAAVTGSNSGGVIASGATASNTGTNATTGSGGPPAGATGGAMNGTGGAMGGAMSSAGGAMNDTGGAVGGAMSSTGGGLGAGGGGAGGSEPVGGAGGTNGTPPPPPDVMTVQLQEVRQIIRGFGLNTTIVPSDETVPWEQLFTLDGPDALGLSILRIGMNEDGGHRDVPSSWETARTLGAKIIGSCWSAPATWKDNGSTTGGGHLLPEYYDDWATRIADYANEHSLYAMSVGNETDFASCSPSQNRPCEAPLTDEYESMVYTGKELADFVKVAGPIFDERAPNTKMIAPEASLWIHVWSNLSPTNKAGGGHDSSDPLECNCFSNDINDTAALAACDPKCTDGEGGYDYGHWLAKDQAAWDAFDILGVHEYESQVGYPWPADVTDGVRTKEVWQTEMSGVMHWPEQGPSIDINNGVAVARWIHSALTVGEASAWLYWWYEAYFQNDNEGLALLKTRDGEMNPTTTAKRYYALGNFSRFIRPDVFHAVQVAGPTPDDVMVSAYKGDNGEVVIVAINETSQPVELPIAITGGTAPTSMTPWVTSEQDNLVAKDPVELAAGVLNAALPAMTITSFVSN